MNNSNEIAKYLDDYLMDYHNYTKDSIDVGLLVFVEIEKDCIKRIEIQDYPTEHINYDINNKEISPETISVGLYQQIPIELIIIKKLVNDFDGFISKDSSFIDELPKDHYVYDKDGNKLGFTIEDGLMEYTPTLKSEYLIRKRIKRLEFSNGLFESAKIEL
ncbi:MAG: hypothetical protein CL526_11485 [Aequorivita sp.]|nr:hypothetical protein [Aequorivita sp.]